MKIIVPVDNKNNETSVCVSFGRTPYFLIYDTDSSESLFIDNIAATSPGGAGIQAAQIIVDNNANIVITPRLGKNAADVLKAAEIKIYKTKSTLAKENIDLFMDEKLALLDEAHEGFHNHGGR